MHPFFFLLVPLTKELQYKLLTFNLQAATSAVQGQSTALKRIEVNIHRRTVKWIGNTTTVSPISGSSFQSFLVHDDKSLKGMHVIGSPDENTEMSELDELNKFFQLFCEKIEKIKELTIMSHFSTAVADMISMHLFQKLRIKQLKVHRTKMDAFDLTPLSTLEEFSIASMNRNDGANAIAYKPCAKQIKALLQANANLKRIIVPQTDRDTYAAITNECKDKAKFHLGVAHDDGAVSKHVEVTKKKISAILDSNDDNKALLDLLIRSKTVEMVEVTVASIKTETDRIAYAINGLVDPLTWMVHRSDQLYGAEWKKLIVDTPITDENDPQRIQSAIFVLRKRVTTLKKLTVRCIFMNNNWSPNDSLMSDIKWIGKTICKDAKMKYSLEMDTRQITYKCKFGDTPSAE